MSNENEMREKISVLNKEIKSLCDKKDDYLRLHREIGEVIDKYEEVKRDIIEAQQYLMESSTSDEIKKHVRELDGEIEQIQYMVKSLEDVQKEANIEMRLIDNQLTEKKMKINKIDIEKNKSVTQ